MWHATLWFQNIWIPTLIDTVVNHYPSSFFSFLFLEKYLSIIYFLNQKTAMVIDLASSYDFFYWILEIFILGNYLTTIHFWNQNNNSCHVEQVDFKIFQYHNFFHNDNKKRVIRLIYQYLQNLWFFFNYNETLW